MPQTSNCWALILAGGTGRRLASLTSDACGASVPKQYCSLNGGASLLEETFERACAMTRKRQIVAVVAADLLAERALWNSFIIVARAIAVLALMERRFAAEVTAFRNVWRRAIGADGLPGELERLYEHLPEIDFSRVVVDGSDVPLSVRPVPSCGWTDLGTPARVAACLERLGHRRRSARSPHLDLADAARRDSYRAAAVKQY